MLQNLEKKNVTMLPGLFRERMLVNRNYLLELGTQELLQSYYLEAGIVMPDLQVLERPETAKLHWGWEAPTCQLRGHFLGHWLSAASSLIASENDAALKAKLDEIISELAKCQELNGGEWIGPFPEKYFTRLEKELHVWSPQYVMHKLIMGLTHAYLYAGNEQALTIVRHLADWYIRWTEKVQSTNPHAVYSGEESGMLEMWALLFETTKDPVYETLASRYSNPSLFRRLLEGKDALTNCHTNASIPWAHGAARMYEVTGDEKYKTIVELFWKCAVTDRGSFCTGSANSGEFWVPPFLSGQYLNDRDQEFCTVYNMVRLATYLYRWTGDKQYGDYIERALYNGFLAQQNAQTGMPTYFLPLSAGGHKKWGTKRHDFWCCHGTMVQAQTLYPDIIYYEDPEQNEFLVSQYIPSTAKWDCHGQLIEVSQDTNMKYYNDQAFFDEKDQGQSSRWQLQFKVKASAPTVFTLCLRVPAWVKGAPVVSVNGEALTNPVIEDGYLKIQKTWEDDTIDLFLAPALTYVSLPDHPEKSAIMEGPVVLAGICDKDHGLYTNGETPEDALYAQSEHMYSVFPWKQSTYLTKKQPENFTFRPLYEIDDETYTIYFSLKKPSDQ